MAGETKAVWPKSNAKVGDVVWRRNKNQDGRGKWEKCWVVSKVALKNSSGYFLDIKIKNIKTGETLKVSPFSESNPGYQQYILPPKEEWEQYGHLTNVLNPDLIVVRYPTNSDEPRYKIVCVHCGQELYNRVQQTETASLRFDPAMIDPKVRVGDPEATEGTGFVEGSTDMDDSNTDTVCGCPNSTYEFPMADRPI